MMDKDGNLVTSVDKIEALALETYQERLENRPIKANLSHIKEKKEELSRFILRYLFRYLVSNRDFSQNLVSISPKSIYFDLSF